MRHTNGGKREGAGRPKGRVSLEKAIIVDQIKQRVLRNSHKLINAQLSLAYGVNYLMKITTSKKGAKEVEIVKDPEIIKSYFDDTLNDRKEENEYYYISSEKSDLKAIDSLFDRTIGKATANVDLTTKGESLNEMSYDRAKAIIAGREAGDTGDSEE